MKCPRCKAELPPKPTKKWSYRYGYYQVESYKCPECRHHFMMYYHEKKLSHTIPNLK